MSESTTLILAFRQFLHTKKGKLKHFRFENSDLRFNSEIRNAKSEIIIILANPAPVRPAYSKIHHLTEQAVYCSQQTEK